MLQRAATNAYYWWWASHIRTKQSKWLEQSLQDMNDKVNYTLKIIDHEGDTFAQRAEMYYRKRPEIVDFVEEAFRSYRALAERYDHLSRDLQSANRTIATVFPEQVQFQLDDEDDEGPDKQPKKLQLVPKGANIPKVPKIPKKDFKSQSMLLSKKGTSPRKRTPASAARRELVNSGLTKDEALKEIDKLQKGILALQTKKELARSSYEHSYGKYWDMENEINEMQSEVCNLQDEFGIGAVIDDSEARNLMASTALTSCKEMIAKLEEKHKQSKREVDVEKERIKAAHEKFVTWRRKVLTDDVDNDDQHNEESETANVRQESGTESSVENVKAEVPVDSDNGTLTVIQLVDKVDELVGRVISLETTSSSQAALVKSLRSETDELHEHIRGLENDKVSLASGADDMKSRIRVLEEELRKVKSLYQLIEDQNVKLQTDFTKTSCRVDDLSGRLHSVKMDEDVEGAGLFQEVRVVSDAKEENLRDRSNSVVEVEPEMKGEGSNSVAEVEPETKGEGSNSVVEVEPETKDEGSNSVVEVEPEMKGEEEKKDHESSDHCEGSEKLDVVYEKSQEPLQEEESKKKDYALSESEPEDIGIDDEEDIPACRQLFPNGLDEREKILLEEFTSVLRSYREVKRKLSEVEKKNRDGFFELAVQISELNSAVAYKDDEIQSLRNKLQSADKDCSNLTEGNQPDQEGQQESISQPSISVVSKDCSNPTEGNQSDQEGQQESISQSSISLDSTLSSLISEQTGHLRKTPEEARVNEIKAISAASDSPRAISSVEERIRANIDELLEENLEFWLRFSTSIHQKQKFQVTIQDLKSELPKLRSKQNSAHTTKNLFASEARPIYKHFREIGTELQLWLENNAVLKEEVQGRYASLCSIQDEISRVTSQGGPSKGGEAEISEYQAAKFHGEVLNMKQENTKVSTELQAGLDCVRTLKFDVEDILAKLEEDMGISADKNAQSPRRSTSTRRSRIPLRSFLFGVKLKKQKQQKAPSLFACISPSPHSPHSSPSLHRQASYFSAPDRLP